MGRDRRHFTKGKRTTDVILVKKGDRLMDRYFDWTFSEIPGWEKPTDRKELEEYYIYSFIDNQCTTMDDLPMKPGHSLSDDRTPSEKERDDWLAKR